MQYVKPYRRRCYHLIFWFSFAALLRLPLPLLTKHLIDKVIPNQDIATLNLVGMAILCIFILNYLSHLIKGFLLVTFQEKVVHRFQLKFFRHVLSMSNRFFQERKVGSLLSVLTNDFGKIGTFLSNEIFGVFLDLMTFLFGLSIMFFIHWKMSLLCLGVLPFYLYSVLGFGDKIKNSSNDVQEGIARMQGNLVECLSGVTVAKSFNSENFETMKHSGFWRVLIKTRLKLSLWLYASTGTTSMIGSIAPLIVLWYGGYQVIRGNLTIGEMIAFNSFLSYIFSPIQKTIDLNFKVKDAMAALERILTIFNIKSEIIEKSDATVLKDVKGIVRYENVSFSYDGKSSVIKGISFTAKPGEIVAIVGKSGAGKSTTLMQLFRFFDPQEGSIFIDGINIKDLKIKALRTYVSAVFQETFLFDGSIYDNIRYSRRQASKDEVEEAIRIANAQEFISNLPDGSQTNVGERGIKLSGGQKQRIDIARAILKGSKILILDEATAFLDSESEDSIQKALKTLKSERTIFVIAHKLSTILQADRIIVFENGEIVGQGNHQWLYENNKTYHTIFDQQLFYKKKENEFSIQTNLTTSEVNND